MKRELYRGDCLDILPSHIPAESVDLIYLDPPFNSNANYNLPFKGKNKDYEAVEVFADTWTWTAENDAQLAEMEAGRDLSMKAVAQIVRLAQDVESMERSGVRRARTNSLASYLLNMSLRLMEMRHVLKETGSVYLHCDPTASHYLKLVMDAIFLKKNFRNEIAWCYAGGGIPRKDFPKKHDIIFRYSQTDQRTYNVEYRPYGIHNTTGERATDRDGTRGKAYRKKGTPINDWWTDINPIINWSKERLGYPTQKPLALLERIIKASSNEGDVVLDPFCGCGTTVHAAENLNRQWIGIDISRFAIELIKERIASNFSNLSDDAIRVVGTPASADEARALAKADPFEFEKWVCGRIGVQSMGRRKRPIGSKGPDGGVDGELRIPVIREGRVYEEYAVVQIKGGNVTADAVKALRQTVEDFGAVAGVLVCFEDQMGTVENQRSGKTWSDDHGTYPYIQGFSVEDMLEGGSPILPRLWGRRHGGRITAHVS